MSCLTWHKFTSNALERGRISGNKTLKTIEIIINFPNVALYFLHINGGHLIDEKWFKAKSLLKKSLNNHRYLPETYNQLNTKS